MTGVRVVDGDTIRGDVVLPFGITLRDQTIRALEYDAWESSRARRTVKITDEELAKGREAKAQFAKLVASGRVFVEPGRQERDPYGRLLARVWVHSEDAWISLAVWGKSKGYDRRGDPP